MPNRLLKSTFGGLKVELVQGLLDTLEVLLDIGVNKSKDGGGVDLFPSVRSVRASRATFLASTALGVAVVGGLVGALEGLAGVGVGLGGSLFRLVLFSTGTADSSFRNSDHVVVLCVKKREGEEWEGGRSMRMEESEVMERGTEEQCSKKKKKRRVCFDFFFFFVVKAVTFVWLAVFLVSQGNVLCLYACKVHRSIPMATTEVAGVCRSTPNDRKTRGARI